jgi:hypothetical protein
MKAFRIVLLCGAAALSHLAMAANPKPQAPGIVNAAIPGSQALGMVNAILTFCAEVDPRNAQSFQAEWKTFASGTALGHPAGGDSQKAFDTITAELRLVARPTVAQNCAAGATQWNGKSTAGKDKDKDKDNDSKDKDAGSAKDGKDSSHGKVAKDSDKAIDQAAGRGRKE